MQLRDFEPDDLEAIMNLSVLAWAPVFASFNEVLGDAIYQAVWPDWEKSQAEGVRAYIMRQHSHTLVAEVDGEVVGFSAYEMDTGRKLGEVMFLAVHPDHQNHNIGTELNLAVLRAMKEGGMEAVSVGTGGDPAHAPARRTYEKAGYTPFPDVRYFKKL